jgi:glucarate dehydratase
VSQTPIAADHCYRLDLLTQIVRDDAADVVLADVFGCGGIASTVDYVRIASAFDLGVALHSGTELCVGQAAKLHIHAALRQHIAYDGDAIYPEYVDGVLVGGKLKIAQGMMQVPQGPGLGVELDEAKLAQWELTAERHQALDAFWDETKAAVGVGISSANALVRQY